VQVLINGLFARGEVVDRVIGAQLPDFR